MLFYAKRGERMNRDKRRRAIVKLREKYPDVNGDIGYIPKWVILTEAYPVLSKAVICLAGAALGALSMLPILLI